MRREARSPPAEEGSATAPHISMAIYIRIVAVGPYDAVGILQREFPAFGGNIEVKALRDLERELPPPLDRIVKSMAGASRVKLSRPVIHPASLQIVPTPETANKVPDIH